MKPGAPCQAFEDRMLTMLPLIPRSIIEIATCLVFRKLPTAATSTARLKPSRLSSSTPRPPRSAALLTRMSMRSQRASASAMPLPMFGPAPVTSATLPSSETFMPTAGLAPSVDDHGLDLHVLEDRVGAHGPPEPALLVAAERRPDHAARPERVDRDLPRLGPAGESHGLSDVAGPHGGHQAVARAVGDLERLLLVLDAQHREHGAEDLLLGDAHFGAHLVEDRRLHEVAAVVAVPAQLAAADDDARALLAPAVQVTEHALLLLGADQRPHVDVLVPGADLHLPERRRQFLDDTLADALVDHDARAGRSRGGG